MSILEDKIRKNKGDFDVHVPADGHLDRFRKKLDELHPESKPLKIRQVSLWRIAVAATILLAISLFALLVPRSDNQAVAASQLPRELREAQLYYDNLSEERLSKINECAMTNEEAKKFMDMAEQEISQIDEQSRELEKEYVNSAKNEKVEKALIKSYQSKSEILENIIDQLCKL